MNKIFYILLSGAVLIGCQSNGAEQNRYILHKDIVATEFWVGEPSNADNANIPNKASAWDDEWLRDYGGVDDPDTRDGYYPAGFTPKENPFYFALPFNDFDENGNKKKDIGKYIPWASKSDDPTKSICKNRWIKITTKDGKIAYAQWEDVGPINEDDKDYVFGYAKPKSSFNDHAGLDLSPAVTDYLKLNGKERVDWQFVDSSNVPDGPWKKIVTTQNVNWVDEDKRVTTDTTFQWQLQGKINTSYDAELYDIDLFDVNQSTIDQLHKQGKRVICYFSAGSYEKWRPDAGEFPDRVKGKKMDGWDELWLDIRDAKVEQIMSKRMDLALSKKCDGIEPDNVDGYSNDTGFDLSASDQIKYNKSLSTQAHKRGLIIALKNDSDQAKELEPFFDFILNEQCAQYNECDKLSPFTKANKAAIDVEYDKKYINNTNHARDNLCKKTKEMNITALILPIDLDDSFRYNCK